MVHFFWTRTRFTVIDALKKTINRAQQKAATRSAFFSV